MDSINMIPKKLSNTKLKLSDLNPHLMCVLCGGYYIDATTIVECLHSFCRSCIVKHLESSKYCPICEVQVHKTKPLMNIRPDKTLQDIVYKLVPGLFVSEMRNRRKFYKERPHYIKPNDLESVGEVAVDRKIYVNDENITFSLVYHEGQTPTNVGECYKEISLPIQKDTRYFKCPTGVTVHHLKKLLKAKYELNDHNYKIEIYFRDQVLLEDLTLLDVSYIYLWKSKGNLDLTYKIFENVVKRQKIEAAIKENGILPCPEVLETNTLKTETSVQRSEKEEIRLASVTNEKRDAEEDKKESKSEMTTVAIPALPPPITKVSVENPSEKVEACKVKENGVSGGESKEVQLQISESGVMSISQVEDGEIVRTMEDAAPKVVNNQLITGLGVELNKSIKGNGEANKADTNNRIIQEQQRKTTAKPVKPYKTIRCSPKTWHPVIPKEKLRPTLMKNSDEPKKPLKFFKMRNMPRFLGNPASGVKPLFAEPQDINSEEKKKALKKAETTKNKILKIDPKTLRPIEKEEMKLTQTPNVPNLLTNPFIPNNNHFLFSDLHLLPPNSGNFSNAKTTETKAEKTGAGLGFKTMLPNGSYPPICFPTPEHNPGFYPFSNLAKPPNFPFPVNDKMDPLLRASRLSPFGNLTGFNVAGIHASLPPSISRLLNPHHHFKKINQSLEKKNKEESTKEMTKSCDDVSKIHKSKEDESKKGKEEKKDEVKEGNSEAMNKSEESNNKESEKKCEKVEEEKEIKEKDKKLEEKSGKEENLKEKNEKETMKEIKSNESASKPEVNADSVTNSEKVKILDKDKDR